MIQFFTSILWLLSQFTRRGRMRAAGVLGFIWQTFIPIRRRLAGEQMAAAFPDWDANQVRAGVRQMYDHLAAVIMECGLLYRWSTDIERARRELPELVSDSGFEHYEAARAAGKGCIIVTAHCGNWELFAYSYALKGVPLHCVVRDIENVALQTVWQRVRETSGMKLIAAHRRQGAVRKMIDALAANECVGLVLDQNMTADKGRFVNFFGKPACTLDLAASLSVRTGATVLCGFLERTADGKHLARIYPVPGLPADLEPTAIERTQAYTREIENQIRRQPAQWLWLHRRWKTQPEGAALSSNG